MSYTFSIEKTHSFPTGMLNVEIKQYYGMAQQEDGREVPFYATESPLSFCLSTAPTEEGKKLIDYFSEKLGKPTLKYQSSHPELNKDYTAEWHKGADEIDIMKRINMHLKGGFTSEELE